MKLKHKNGSIVQIIEDEKDRLMARGKVGRKRIGQPRSITLTKEQQTFVEKVMQANDITFCHAVRNIIRDAMLRFSPENTAYSTNPGNATKQTEVSDGRR